MKKIILAVALVIMAFAADAAMACSPQKLSALKQRCNNATNITAKKLYCGQKNEPHSIKLMGEKNYNIK